VSLPGITFEKTDRETAKEAGNLLPDGFHFSQQKGEGFKRGKGIGIAEEKSDGSAGIVFRRGILFKEKGDKKLSSDTKDRGFPSRDQQKIFLHKGVDLGLKIGNIIKKKACVLPGNIFFVEGQGGKNGLLA